MRGTRKLYFHIEVIGKDSEGEKIERYSFQSSQSAVSFASNMLSENEDLTLHIIVHHEIEEGRGIEDSITKSKQIGNNVRRLIGDEDRITIHGLGALLENQGGSPSSIELLVIRP